jgi:ankyrin repeat protein
MWVGGLSYIRRSTDLNKEVEREYPAHWPGIKVNQVDRQGRIPLHLASRYNFLGTCIHLLARGSSINLIDNTGRLPAYYACDIEHNKLLKLLLGRSFDTLILDNRYKAMLMLASTNGHNSVVRILPHDPEVDIDINAADLEGSTTLHHGVDSGNISIVSRLLIAGAVIDVTNKNGFTPLHMAASQLADIIVNELSQNGADANALDHDGRTPLHLALWWQRHTSETTVHALLNHYANMDLEDKDGYTALHYACRKLKEKKLRNGGGC